MFQLPPTSSAVGERGGRRGRAAGGQHPPHRESTTACRTSSCSPMMSDGADEGQTSKPSALRALQINTANAECHSCQGLIYCKHRGERHVSLSSFLNMVSCSAVGRPGQRAGRRRPPALPPSLCGLGRGSAAQRPYLYRREDEPPRGGPHGFLRL